jgi:K+-sensing histidine kinase KdpD
VGFMKPEKNNSTISYSDIQLLNQIGQDFTSQLDFDAVIDTIMFRVRNVIHCEASSVILYDEIRDSLVFYAASGLGAREIEGLTIPRGEGFAGWVFEHDEPVIIENASEDTRFYSGIDKITHLTTKSLICVPIKKQDKILGVIEGINKIGEPFSQRDLALLIAISQLAGISIENSMIHKNLEEKNSRLLALNKEMEEFVYIISHDLQTPLASIEGYIGLIKSEMANLLQENNDLNTYIMRIEENCKNTFHFIRRLLSFIKLNDSTLSIQEFDPSSVVDEVLVVLEDDIRDKNARVTSNLNVKSISYDRSVFYHILLNLIQNSLKYSAKGRKPLIEAGDEDANDMLHFYIRDNGPGIPEGDRERIFKWYERGINMGVENGYGVGLAFVKKAVEMFQGKVWVETEENKGSTFYFSIPK